MRPASRLCRFLFLVAAFAIAITWRSLSADEMVLKNNTVLEGKPVALMGLSKKDIAKAMKGPVKNYPVLMVETGMKRYFVPDDQVADRRPDAGLTNAEEFKIRQRRGPRRQMPQILGAVRVLKDFSANGRRTVAIKTPRGEQEIVQGITRLNPRYLTVTAMTELDWEFGIATTSLKQESLDAILHNVIDQENPRDRMGAAVFYLQAGMYLQAGQELDSIIRDFPSFKATAEKVVGELRSAQANRLLTDLQRRIDSGQNHLAAAALLKFPKDNMSAAVQKDIRDLGLKLQQSRENFDRAASRISELAGQLEDEAQRSQLEPLRSAIRKEMMVFNAVNGDPQGRLRDIEGLKRLDAFLKFENDATLSADKKLALAYSGWVMGPADSITDLKQTLRYWEARTLVLDALRPGGEQHQTEILAKLTDIEGVSEEIIVKMLPYLPPLLETPGILSGEPHTIEVKPDGIAQQTIARYDVLLPHEYSPQHSYPVIVALHPGNRDPDWELRWWGGDRQRPGQAQRHGYIVIAPEYLPPKITKYDYDVAAHEAVLNSINDARRRFNIDSDRIFLAGHGVGANAVYDIAMSHPDVFAGAIPISGTCDRVCKWYWENARFTSWYIVSGELAPGWLQDPENGRDQAAILSRMIRRGFSHDMIIAEYIGRGYESYYAEIHMLFDWMNRHRRQKQPEEWRRSILRPADAKLFGMHAEGFNAAHLQRIAAASTENGRMRGEPMRLDMHLSAGSDDYNKITLRSPAARHVLWLSPDFVDYSKRLHVILGGRRKYNEFPEGDIGTMLDDYRKRGDRQRIYWTRLEL